MAIALDNSAQFTTSTSSVSGAYTCTGSNLILIAACWNGSSTANGVSSISYNSVSMTNINSITQASTGRLQLYYLKAPATGSNTFSCTWSGSSQKVMALIISLTGVDQTSPINSSNPTSSAASGTSINLNITPDGNNYWFISGAAHATTSNAFSSSQNIAQQATLSGTTAKGGLNYSGPFSTTQTMNWSWTSSAPNMCASTAIKPASTNDLYIMVT